MHFPFIRNEEEARQAFSDMVSYLHFQVRHFIGESNLCLCLRICLEYISSNAYAKTKIILHDLMTHSFNFVVFSFLPFF